MRDKPTLLRYNIQKMNNQYFIKNKQEKHYETATENK